MHRYVLQNQEGKNGGKEFATIHEIVHKTQGKGRN